MTRRIGALFLTIVIGASTSSATTVLPMSFREIVEEAELIFTGEVIDVRSAWQPDRDGRHIVTIVTFNVDRVLKGRVGLRTELTFLGGTIGRQHFEIVGMPQFEIGERSVLFVAADPNAASPLVGFWHGRFRIVHDRISGEDTVRTHKGSPLIAGFGADDRTLGAVSRTAIRTRALLDVNQFESLVRDQASRSSRQR